MATRYVYISGGAGRESVRDSAGNRLTKGFLARRRFVVQRSPNHMTDLVILPDGVRYMSRTTFSKLRPGAYVEVREWRQFQRKYLRSSQRSAGNQRAQLQQSLAEERGTGRTWRLRRGQELLSRNSSRTSKTRGWSLDFPTRGKERQELYAKCGSRCFLGPNLSFPVCKRCFKGDCRGCRVDPRGVQAAYQRARQWGHTSVASRADALRKNPRVHASF